MPQTTHDDNGILAKIPGQYVAQACLTLRDPKLATDETMSVKIDAAWACRVSLTFSKHRYRRPNAKASYVAWICHHAFAVTPGELTQNIPPECPNKIAFGRLAS